MTSKHRLILVGAVVCAVVCVSVSSLNAATIIKLNLGNVTPDLQLSGGVFSTSNDLIAGTTGDQNTAIEYVGFLEPIPDVATSVASFSLSNVLVAGIATIDGSGLVNQSFLGGNFNLYDSSNGLLLSGALGTSQLVGTPGPPGVGAVFTTSIASVTGGSLTPLIIPTSLGLSFTLTDVNDGNGFTFTPGSALDPFTANSTANISGDPTPVGENFPEPGTIVLAAAAVVVGSVVRRRGR